LLFTPATCKAPARTSRVIPARQPTVTINWILGAPRSGTTWLGKIFDSHPDVLYRNEPDAELPSETLPLVCQVEDLERYRDPARAYLERLIDTRTLRSAGSLPVFRKNYQTLKAHWLRLGMVHGLHLSNFAARGTRWHNNKVIPDIIDGAGWSQPTIVIKSVSAHERTRLFLEALPRSRIIFIIRHPCGQVASMLRGFALGKFGNQSLLQDLRRHFHVWRLARHRGAGLRHLLSKLLSADRAQQPDDLLDDRFEALPKVEQLAWWWATINQKTIDDLTGLSSVRIVRYEDLVADTTAVVRALFEFTGLTWDSQTAAFIRKSTTSGGRDRYYGVRKQSTAITVKWREQLSSDDQCRILDIAHSVPIGRLFGKVDPDDEHILPGWWLERAPYSKSLAEAGARLVR
jgi:Sulfotransferase family